MPVGLMPTAETQGAPFAFRFGDVGADPFPWRHREWFPTEGNRPVATIATPTQKNDGDFQGTLATLTVTLLHGDCEARIGAGAGLSTRRGRKRLARDRTCD